MMLRVITLTCFIINALSQQIGTNGQNYDQFLNQGQLYFPGFLPRPLSLQNEPDENVLKSIFGTEHTRPPRDKVTVEVEKTNIIASGIIPEDNNGDVLAPGDLPDRQLRPQRIPQNGRPSGLQNNQQINTRRPEAQFIPNRRTTERYTNDGQIAQSVISSQTLAQNTKFTAQNLPNSQILAQNTPSGQIFAQNNQNNQATGPQLANAPQAGYNNLLYSVTNFGINLLKTINANQPGNVVVSPYSITTLLALLQQGALGQTQEEITAALQMAPSQSVSSYSNVNDDIKNRNSHNILKTANNMFLADGFSINPEFKKIAIRSFDSDVTPVSYSRPDLTARQINSWVASRTNNMIERLVAPESLDSTTQMVLVNAVYFKGIWEAPFRVESTRPRDFHLRSGETKSLQFMQTRKMFKTGVDPATNAKVIVLPFEREQYSMMVILPHKQQTMENTLSSLTDARLLSYHSFESTDTELEIPKFTAKADTDLTKVLRSMGISRLFSKQAELAGVGRYRAFAPLISSAVHSAVLSIDEQGASAAAATAFAAVALSYDVPSVIFRVDRPFIAVLWDSKTSLPLFMAKIEDPQQ